MSDTLPTVTWEHIGPAQASAYIATNQNNYRKVRAEVVTRYATNMRNGTWTEDNGATIVFDHAGRLVDGQHRMHAVVACGQPFRFLVVRGGTDKGSDRNLGRNVVQDVAHLGQPQASKTIAAARIVALFEKGLINDIPNGGIRAASFPWMTDSFLCDMVQRCEGIHVSVMFGSNYRVLKCGFAGAPVAATHYLLRGDMSDFRDEFFESLFDGAGLHKGSPILALRNAIGVERTHAIRHHHRMSSRRMLALLWKAWNAWVCGVDVQLLKFIDSESIPSLITTCSTLDSMCHANKR